MINLNLSVKIAVVLVTFNRKELLVQCLNGLMGQSRIPEKIFLIDNASTDGTRDYLFDLGFLNIPFIEYIQMGSNTGGAGGFHEGVKRAFEEKFDWLWLMDDDGRPETTCLEMLMMHSKNFSVLGPLIISSENENKTSFSYPINGNHTNLVKDAIELPIINHVHPFNGTLIDSKVINKIGFPEKKFFIWGDEIDYSLKWNKAGFSEATITSARFYHPPDRQMIRQIFKYALPLIEIKDRRRKYIYYRNKIYNYRCKTESHFKTSIIFIFSIISVLFFDNDRWSCVRGLYDGYISNFDK